MTAEKDQRGAILAARARAQADLAASVALPPLAFSGLSEASRVALVSARGDVPDVCGPDIPHAPARGAFRVFMPEEMVPGSTERTRNTGYRAEGEAFMRKAMALADIFDTMEEMARRDHKRHGGAAEDFVPPFTPGQVSIGRDYRFLTERHNGSGMRGASAEVGAGASSARGGEFIDAYVAEGIRLAAMHRRIGSGIAMRRVRPSQRGTGVITDRALVDAVCIGQKSLSDVLVVNGWKRATKNLALIRTALGAVLDRMQGYRPGDPTK